MKAGDNRKVIAVFSGAFVISFCLAAAADDLSQFEEIEASYFETDVRKVIQLRSGRDVVDKRKALIRYIWGEEGFPLSKLPESVQEDIKDAQYGQLEQNNLKRIDKITVGMDYGLNSVVYHFIAKKCNKKLIIYHQGHRGDFVKGINTIKACLDKGYCVMGFSMPLLGMNSRPTVELERFGRLKLTKHDHLKFLEHPIKYFVEPVAVALNYAAKFRYQGVYMVGISGGGWTTTLYSAIDARIRRSYPVAGSFPVYLRSGSSRDWGDYEQTVPGLYRVANYPELYIMASHSKGRKQIQILNKYDSCCFAGIKYRTYEKVVKEVVEGLGEGEFEVFLDDTHKEHKISGRALDVIFNDLENR